MLRPSKAHQLLERASQPRTSLSSNRDQLLPTMEQAKQQTCLSTVAVEKLAPPQHLPRVRHQHQERDGKLSDKREQGRQVLQLLIKCRLHSPLRARQSKPRSQLMSSSLSAAGAIAHESLRDTTGSTDIDFVYTTVIWVLHTAYPFVTHLLARVLPLAGLRLSMVWPLLAKPVLKAWQILQNNTYWTCPFLSWLVIKHVYTSRARIGAVPTQTWQTAQATLLQQSKNGQLPAVACL